PVGGEWTGTAAALLGALEAHVPESVRRDRMRWPQSARGLSGALRRLGPALRAAGVHVEHLPRQHGGARPLRVAHGGDSTVTIVTTVPEPVSPGPAGDGRPAAGERPSPRPSPENPSNGAGGDGGDDGDRPIPTSDGWGEG